MKTSDFDYYLPPGLIAQSPIEPRDRSRLMVLDRNGNSLRHHFFRKVADYFQAGDLLVFNNSRVIPARLIGKRVDSRGEVEILLLRRLSPNLWETLVRPGKRVRIGTRIEISNGSATPESGSATVTAEAVGVGEGGTRTMNFSDETLLAKLGAIPLPPYIHRPLADPERYQTVYADADGSAASPTAGLHFTDELIDRIQGKGVGCLFITLHIGLDTFRPIRQDNPLEHPIHQEYGIIGKEAADELSRARRERRRIIGVGTTTARLAEAAAQASSTDDIVPFEGWVDLFIVPGYRFRVVDALITNFHLPRSTLLLLVSAFAGSDLIKRAYQEAIARKYRFYSFGDAMLII